MQRVYFIKPAFPVPSVFLAKKKKNAQDAQKSESGL
jgi:hypothetical protein